MKVVETKNSSAGVSVGGRAQEAEGGECEPWVAGEGDTQKGNGKS